MVAAGSPRYSSKVALRFTGDSSGSDPRSWSSDGRFGTWRLHDLNFLLADNPEVILFCEHKRVSWYWSMLLPPVSGFAA